MSGYPTEEPVRLLRHAVDRMAQAQKRGAVLAKEINVRKEELANQNDEFRKSRDLVLKYLREMDVVAPGNMGWEERISALFVELNNQGMGNL